LLLAAGIALGQAPKPEFEVASIKPAEPIQAQTAAGNLHLGTQIDGARVDIGSLPLADLISMAIRVKPYQLSGPDWMSAGRFDVMGKMPEGATKEQVPEMLQALLTDRFKLTIHRETTTRSISSTQISRIPYTDKYALIVGGSITTAGQFTMGSGTNLPVWVGGTYAAFNSPAPTVVQPPTASDFDFLAARTSLDNLSSNTLENYGTAVIATPTSNGTNYVLTATGSGLLVYNVDASYFDNSNLGFQVNVSTGQSVVINVTGAAADFTLSKGTVIVYNGVTVNANTTGGVPVLFNLPEVTTLNTSNGAINGSILAPYAIFNSPNQDVDGQIIAASVEGLAETHDQYYNGTLPSLSTATPEPATFLLFGVALIAIGPFGPGQLSPAAERRARPASDQTHQDAGNAID
jgi:choice-of-anchor A domain-containing protein